MKISKIEKQLRLATSVQPKEGETEQDYLVRMVQGVADLPEDTWNKLSEPAQAWFNAAAEAINSGQPVDKIDKSVEIDKPLESEPTQSEPVEKTPLSNEEVKLPRTSKKELLNKTIYLLIEKNPKKPSGAAHKRFELYRSVKTVTEFLVQGGTLSDIRYDSAHGYIELRDAVAPLE